MIAGCRLAVHARSTVRVFGDPECGSHPRLQASAARICDITRAHAARRFRPDRRITISARYSATHCHITADVEPESATGSPPHRSHDHRLARLCGPRTGPSRVRRSPPISAAVGDGNICRGRPRRHTAAPAGSFSPGTDRRHVARGRCAPACRSGPDAVGGRARRCFCRNVI